MRTHSGPSSRLYAGADFEQASATIRRIGALHAHRAELERAGHTAMAVEDAATIMSMVAAATAPVLRAMVVQLTTPELRPPGPPAPPAPAPPGRARTVLTRLIRALGAR